jgi:hypothetical protein
MRSEAMKKFDFLLGEWSLEYRIPKSSLANAGSDAGTGTFTRALDDRYVFLDYSTQTGSGAHGVFAWDANLGKYRYWWFENSGSFLSATCDFVADGVLAMNWHDSLLVQTFAKDGDDRVVLRMYTAAAHGGHELVLEVIFTRRLSKGTT